MTEKLYGDFPRYGKSYFTEQFNEMYSNIVKKCLDATMGVVNEYVEYWSDNGVQEFYYDVSPLEVLKELKKTLITGEYPTRMMENIKND